jgi:transposase
LAFKKFTKEDEIKVINLYNQGLPMSEIAKMFGVAINTINRTLRINNITIRSSAEHLKKLNKKQENEAISLYKQGFTIGKIASYFKVSDNSISRVLKQNNIKIRKITDYKYWKILSLKEKIEILNLYKGNLSSNKIGEKLGIGKGRVVKILRKNNIQLKPPGDFLKKLNESQEKEVQELYSKDFSISEISRSFGVAHGVINKILEDNNIEKKEPGIYHKKISKEEEQDVLDLYLNQKLFVNEIAAKYNVELRTISTVLKDHNIKILTSKEMRKLTPEQEQEMIKLYWQGYSTYQLAEKFNISRTSVKRIFNRNDVKIYSVPAKKSTIVRKIKESQYPKIIELYKEGLTQEKIGKLYDVTEETIRKILHKNNVPIRKNSSQKLFKKQIKEIIKLYEQDVSTINISEQFNVDKSTIKRLLKKNDVEMKGPGYFNKKITENQESEMIILYQQGLSLSKVAEKLGISGETVNKFLKNNNIEIRDGAEYHKKVNSEIEKKIIALYNQNVLLKKIAQELNLSPNTVSITLKRNNIEVINFYQNHKKINENDKKEILNLYQNGLLMREIAPKFNISESSVSKIIKKLKME